MVSTADNQSVPGDPPSIDAEPRPSARCNFDPNAGIGAGSAIVEDASFGNLPALRILLDVSIDAAFAQADDNPYGVVAAAEAVTFARLCAAHRMPLDVRKLAGALCLTSERTRRIGFDGAADNLMGESIAILERLADEGDDIAAMASARLVALHPATVEIAKSILSVVEE
jgi:hypothetical protein